MAVSKLKAADERSIECSAEEWEARLDLACAYRLFFHLGWHGLIFNHLTLRVPGPESHFLINPFGLMYREVTASNLLKVDLEGRKVTPSPHPMFEIGFVVHSSVHKSRPELHCVLHTHTPAGVAVSCQEDGLLPIQLAALGLCGSIAYHDVEGVTTERNESDRIGCDLGDKKLMILRNHGLIACGETIAEAFYLLYLLEQCCEIQVAAQGTGARLRPVPDEIVKRTQQQMLGGNMITANGPLLWQAMRRWMDDIDPGYRT